MSNALQFGLRNCILVSKHMRWCYQRKIVMKAKLLV